MDYERIHQLTLNNAVGGGLSPRKLGNMLLGVDKKRRDDTEPDSILDLQLPETENSSNSSSDNCKDVDVVTVSAKRVSLAPFSKPAPSKWDDAQKWIASPTSNRLNLGLSKSQKATHFGYGRQLSTKVVVEVVPDQRLVASSMEPDTKRIDSVESYNKPVLMIENTVGDSAVSLSQHESLTIQSATTFIPPPSTAMSISMRDMGTEMTPTASQEPSRTGTPVKATTPSSSRASTPPKTPPSSSSHTHLTHHQPNSALCPKEQLLQTRKEIMALGTQLGKYNITAWASKEEGNGPSSYTEPQKSAVEMRAAAWEEAERAKYIARFKRGGMRIEAWENHQMSENEAEMRKVEVEVERIKGRAQDMLMNKLAAVRLKAEEKLAAAEAHRDRRAVKTEQQSDHIRTTGRIPSSSSSLSFSFFWCCS